MYEHPFIGASTGLSVGSEEVPSIRPFFHVFDIPSMHRSVYLRNMLAVFKRIFIFTVATKRLEKMPSVVPPGDRSVTLSCHSSFFFRCVLASL